MNLKSLMLPLCITCVSLGVAGAGAGRNINLPNLSRSFTRTESFQKDAYKVTFKAARPYEASDDLSLSEDLRFLAKMELSKYCSKRNGAIVDPLVIVIRGPDGLLLGSTMRNKCPDIPTEPIEHHGYHIGKF